MAKAPQLPWPLKQSFAHRVGEPRGKGWGGGVFGPLGNSWRLDRGWGLGRGGGGGCWVTLWGSGTPWGRLPGLCTCWYTEMFLPLGGVSVHKGRGGGSVLRLGAKR